jgi:hypothetical protein
MASKLTLLQYIDLPHHPEGDFDHGDVSLAIDYVFIANTACGRFLSSPLSRDGASRKGRL